jgi:hypothetical protein
MEDFSWKQRLFYSAYFTLFYSSGLRLRPPYFMWASKIGDARALARLDFILSAHAICALRASRDPLLHLKLMKNSQVIHL